MSDKQKNRTDRLGVALIVSGPSGTGKSTVCSEVQKLFPDMGFSISCTTRAPRPGEEDGRDYYFITKDDFIKRIEENLFIEYAEVHGNYYGTLRSEVMDKVTAGYDVLLDIDVQGAMQIKKYAEQDAIFAKSLELLFIGPPSFEELERRLRSRNTETEEAIRVRLENAKSELEQWQEYGYLIINDDLERAVEEMKSFLNTMHKSTRRLNKSGFFE